MLRCPICANENDDRAAFCEKCGSVLAGVTPEDAPAAPASATAPIPPLPSEPSRVAAAAPAASDAAVYSHEAFPHLVPAVLKWSDRRLRLTAGTIGILLGVASSALVYFASADRSVLREMFDPRRLSSLIPVSIACAFFWGAAICWLRWRRTRVLERLSDRGLLIAAERDLSSGRLVALARALDEPGCRASPLLRRLHAVVQQWEIRPGLQDADIVLQQHVGADEAAVHTGYGLVRTFVWALPVLGLIGTVIGISVAVGGFAQFLGGDIEDVAVIKQNLVGVTAGLSFAFLITLQGLLTSLLLMLASAGLESREDKLYTRVQQAITDAFLPVLQRVAPEPAASGSGSDVGAWRETMRATASDILQAVREESARSLERAAEGQAALVDRFAASLEAKADGGARRLEIAAGRIGDILQAANDRLIQRLEATLTAPFEHQGRALDESARAAATLLDTTAQAGASAIRSVGTTVEGLSLSLAAAEAARSAEAVQQLEALRATTSAVASLTETTRQALASQAVLQSALESLGDGRLGHAFNGFSAALSTQSSEMHRATDAMCGFTAVARDVLAAQATLQGAVERLREAGFAETLAGFRETLSSVGGVLSSFREPFVLQAVPATPPRARHAGADSAGGA